MNDDLQLDGAEELILAEAAYHLGAAFSRLHNVVINRNVLYVQDFLDEIDRANDHVEQRLYEIVARFGTPGGSGW